MQPPRPLPIDVIIPTRNRGASLTRTLLSLLADANPQLRIWVVDQSDGDATARAVQPFCHQDERVHYLQTPTRGISSARNLGAQRGAAPYVLFTDDDCRAAPGWASALATELADGGAWAAFGRLLPEWRGAAPPARWAAALPLAIKRSEAREVYAGNPRQLGFGHGASMGVRRERLEALGGFDEALGVGGPLRSWEDRDLGHRILHTGGQIVYTPRALTYHQQRNHPAEVYATFYDYGIGAGATAAKYLRCGDPVGAAILGEWLLGQGLRQVLSGLFKWRCWPKTAVGLQQLAVTWQGMALGLRYPVDQARRLYLAPGSALAQKATW